MSKKQESKQYNKFYHNDIKKQLGIDQSRTASQKLLDKVIKVDKRADFYLTQIKDVKQLNSQPKKKIKPNTEGQSQKPMTNLQILEIKLMKNIQNQQNIAKLLKSLTILKKCLNQQSFLNDPQINFGSNWKKYTDKLINQINERNFCSSQSLNIMSNIGDCIQILIKNFAKKEDATEEGQLKNQKQMNQIYTNEQIWINFCRLFTDDSFIFHKNLNKLKGFIFYTFNKDTETSQEAKPLVIFLIKKIVSIPIKLDWIHSALVNLFKQFNNQGYQNEFGNDVERKEYLKSYNELLNRKPKSTGSDGSFNIMGNVKQSTGLKTVHIEADFQNSSDKWINKQ